MLVSVELYAGRHPTLWPGSAGRGALQGSLFIVSLDVLRAHQVFPVRADAASRCEHWRTQASDLPMCVLAGSGLGGGVSPSPLGSALGSGR